MFEHAYLERSPLFGDKPTHCVTMMCEMMNPMSRIADLGCGDGRDSLFLLERGFEVISVDLSRNAIAALKRNAESRGLGRALTTFVGDVSDWRVEEESLDAVIGVTILDHVKAEDHQAVISSIASSLKPGGLVAIEMHSDRDPAARGALEKCSEFADAIESYSKRNSLLSHFLCGWRILFYSDRLEWDHDHGEPHQHGFVTIVARKELE